MNSHVHSEGYSGSNQFKCSSFEYQWRSYMMFSAALCLVQFGSLSQKQEQKILMQTSKVNQCYLYNFRAT